MALFFKITLNYWLSSLKNNTKTTKPSRRANHLHCGAIIYRNVQLKRTFQKEKHADIQPGGNKAVFSMLTTQI